MCKHPTIGGVHTVTLELGLGRVPDSGYPADFKAGYPVLAGYLSTFEFRQITGYRALKISLTSGIWIVSISGIRPDI